MEENIDEQPKNRRGSPYWVKGMASPNPNGRPKGSKSMKQWVKETLETMDEDKRQEFLEGLPKDIIWRMAEGQPDTKTDITSKGESITAPTPEELAFAKQLLEQRKQNGK